jgi:hypothetical protein
VPAKCRSHSVECTLPAHIKSTASVLPVTPVLRLAAARHRRCYCNPPLSAAQGSSLDSMVAESEEISLRPMSLRPGGAGKNPFAAFGKGAGAGLRSRTVRHSLAAFQSAQYISTHRMTPHRSYQQPPQQMMAPRSPGVR